MEASEQRTTQSERDVEAVNRAFDRFGVIVIEELDRMGAGDRLKFTRRMRARSPAWKAKAGYRL